MTNNEVTEKKRERDKMLDNIDPKYIRFFGKSDRSINRSNKNYISKFYWI